MLFLLFLCQVAMALTHSVPEEDPYYNNVVMTQTVGLDEVGDEVMSYCTGTLLSSQIIVTAAHCVNHAFALKSDNVQISIGQYVYYSNNKTSAKFRMYKTIISKEFKARFLLKPSLVQKINSQGYKAKVGLDEDFAFIELKEDLPLPLDFKYAKILPPDLQKNVLKNISAYKIKAVSINFMTTVTSMDTKRSGEITGLRVGNGYLKTNSSISETEPYDSGSPLFVNYGGENYVLALVKDGLKNFLYKSYRFSLITDLTGGKLN